MKHYPTVTIEKLDTGYLIESDEQRFALTSNDVMIAKVRELLNISRRIRPSVPTESTEQIKSEIPHQIPEPTPPTTTKLKDAMVEAKHNNLKYGILSNFTENGKWPIKKEDFIVPELISIPANEKVKYAETEDGRILIEYQSGRVYTAWEEIIGMLSTIKPGSELLNVPHGFSSNQRTCIRQFMIAVRDNGIKPGNSIDLDPDKDFRKQLDRSSQPEYEAGTLKEVLEE